MGEPPTYPGSFDVGLREGASSLDRQLDFEELSQYHLNPICSMKEQSLDRLCKFRRSRASLSRGGRDSGSLPRIRIHHEFCSGSGDYFLLAFTISSAWADGCDFPSFPVAAFMSICALIVALEHNDGVIEFALEDRPKPALLRRLSSTMSLFPF